MLLWLFTDVCHGPTMPGNLTKKCYLAYSVYFRRKKFLSGFYTIYTIPTIYLYILTLVFYCNCGYPTMPGMGLAHLQILLRNNFIYQLAFFSNIVLYYQ